MTDGPAREVEHPTCRGIPEFRQQRHGSGDETVPEQRENRDFHPELIPEGEQGSEGKGTAKPAGGEEMGWEREEKRGNDWRGERKVLGFGGNELRVSSGLAELALESFRGGNIP